MITDLGRYYRRVRQEEANLPVGATFLFITSIENEDQGPNASAGRVVEVLRERAAENIVAKTHRLSTEDEIDFYRNGQRTAGESIRQAEFEKRQPIAITVLSDGTARVAKGSLPTALAR